MLKTTLASISSSTDCGVPNHPWIARVEYPQARRSRMRSSNPNGGASTCASTTVPSGDTSQMVSLCASRNCQSPVVSCVDVSAAGVRPVVCLASCATRRNSSVGVAGFMAAPPDSQAPARARAATVRQLVLRRTYSHRPAPAPPRCNILRQAAGTASANGDFSRLQSEM